MCDYSLVIYFSYDRAFVQIVENKTYYLGPINSIYDTSCIVKQDSTVFVRIDDSPIKPSYQNTEKEQDCKYIHNIVTDTLLRHKMEPENSPNQQISVFKIFSQYLKYILTDCIQTQKTQSIHPQEIDNYNFVFITPRAWGYHIDQNDIYRIFHLAGLVTEDFERRVTVYADLYLYLTLLQRAGLFIRSLRKCLYCTFFVDMGISGYNSLNTNLDVFKSGTSFEYTKTFGRNPYIIPVNYRSIPSLKAEPLDILKIYHKIEDYITTKLFRTKSDQGMRFDIRDLLYYLNSTLKTMKVKDRGEQCLKKIYPFENISDDGYLEELSPALSIEEKEILKAISMHDIYEVIKPQLWDYCLGLNSIIDKYNIRETFLELFPITLQIDDWYMYTAWVSVYFLQWSILFEIPEYRNVHFVNVRDHNSMYVDDVICFHLSYVSRYESFDNFQAAKLCFAFVNDTIHSALKIENNRETRIEALESNSIVIFSISIDESRISLYSKVGNDKFKLLNESESTSDGPIFALNHASKISFKSNDNCESGIELLRQRVLKTMELFHDNTLSLYAKKYPRKLDQEICDLKGNVFHSSDNLFSYEGILNDLHQIQLQSKQLVSKQKMFRHHFMSIFLILYIIYVKNRMNHNISLDEEQTRYVIVLDSFVESIVGDSWLILKSFSRMFGFFTKDTVPAEYLAFVKQREIYSLKTQNTMALKKLPVLSSVFQFQITRNSRLVNSRLDSSYLDIESQKIVLIEEGVVSRSLSFYGIVTEEIWNYFQHVSHCDENKVFFTGECTDLSTIFTLENFNQFERRVTDFMANCLLLPGIVDLDKETNLHICDSYGYQISYRSFIEVALKPAMKTITLLLFERLKKFTRMNIFFKQIILIFEDMEITTNRDNLLQQILKDILGAQIAEFCNNDKHYIKQDFTLLETHNIYNEIISNNLHDLYTVNHGTKTPYLAFRNTYAIKFCQSYYDNEDELKIYANNSTQEDPQALDLDKFYVLARKNAKLDNIKIDYRAIIPRYKEICLIQVIKINSSIEEDSFDQSYLEKLNYLTIGQIELRTMYFQHERYTDFPIMTVSIKPHSTISLLSIMVSTTFYCWLDVLDTVEPLKVNYNDY